MDTSAQFRSETNGGFVLGAFTALNEERVSESGVKKKKKGQTRELNLGPVAA